MTNPSPTPMDALKEARDLAMKNTTDARIPECGDFGAIAQNLDWAITQLEASPDLRQLQVESESVASNYRLQELLENFHAQPQNSEEEFEAEKEVFAHIDSIITTRVASKLVGHFVSVNGRYQQVDPDCWPDGSPDSIPLYMGVDQVDVEPDNTKQGEK